MMNKKTSILFSGALLVFLLSFTSTVSAAHYNLKLAHNLPATKSSLLHQAALKFKALVEKDSGGQLTVQIFPATQLGSDVSVAKKVQSGAVEMEIITANKLGAFYPAIDIYSLPFLLNDFDVAARVFKEPIHKSLISEMEKKTGLKAIAFIAQGFRNITNSKHPINKPQDLRDLKIRVPKNKIELALFKALGANPVNIPGSELFSALQQGVADGQDGAAAWAFAKKIYEVQKYLAVTHHQLSCATMIINARFFNSLPKADQGSILKAGAETQVFWQKISKDTDVDIIEKFKAKGMAVSRPDLTPFTAIAQSIYPEFAGRVGGMDRIKAIQAVK
jgi:tripartite ATP-independent transporter DctP family solute receptor